MTLSKRKYYSARKNKRTITVTDLYYQVKTLFYYFRDKDYFKEKLNITKHDFPDEAKYKAVLETGKHIFPIEEWKTSDYTEDNIFDTLEFLYDNISRPTEIGYLTTETGFNYQDYIGYNEEQGKAEFREMANKFLEDYGDGFELTEAGNILSIGTDGAKYLYDAEIIQYDYENVDSKVISAIQKWGNRRLDIEERKQAIIELANVFEWLKKTDKLEHVLNKKDESAIFEIANKFHLRHHDPKQIKSYDKNIWYSWIFHFYLASYHAVIRLIKKQEKES